MLARDCGGARKPSAKSLIADLAAQVGGLDDLVNNAGIAGEQVRPNEATIEHMSPTKPHVAELSALLIA